MYSQERNFSSRKIALTQNKNMNAFLDYVRCCVSTLQTTRTHYMCECTMLCGNNSLVFSTVCCVLRTNGDDDDGGGLYF